MLTGLIAAYVATAALTFVHLLHVGRPGLSRRGLQILAALGWPLYWPLVQGMKPTGVALGMAFRTVLGFVLWPVALLLIALVYGVLCACNALVRAGLMPSLSDHFWGKAADKAMERVELEKWILGEEEKA